jgi:hypothetical protein
MLKLRALPAALVIAIGLTACGGGGGSSDNPTATASSSGVLVDDLVVDASVFCDSNSNGRLDSGEVQTTTGDDGVFTFSPACTAPVVSVAGTGYDKTSLKSPRGHFRGRAHAPVVSPFTTMQLASGLSEAQFRAVLVKLGLDVDASTFNPATHANLGPTAAAVIKILNEIAAIVESAGGDPALAFEAAAGAIVSYVNAHSTSGSILERDLDLGDLIEAAASAGFASVPTATWSNTARANAAKLAREGLVLLVKAIKGHARYADIHDDFNNGAVNGIISDTNLDDNDEFEAAKGRCRDNDNTGRAQYVYASDDTFTLVGPGLAGGSTSYTLAQFDAGIDLTGHSLGSLTRLELPLQATTLALPKNGSRVALALEVEEVGGGNRVLQVLIDRLVLKRDKTSGVVSASISDKSELFFYARSASGIEIGTGKNAFENLDASLLTSGGSGVALDLQVLAARMKGKFPTQTDLLDKLLAATGTFKVRLVVNELDLRHTDGSRFGLRKIAVRIPGEPNRVAERITGTAVLGQLTF